MKTEERRLPALRDLTRDRMPSLDAGTSSPSSPAPPCRAADRNPPAAALAPIAALQTSLREQHRESEKLGLIEMLLGSERYRSILEIGCGTGELAGRLICRCARYTGMDDEAARLAAAARAVRAGCFLPFRLAADEPFALPPGEHELIVLSDVLLHIDAARLERLAGALGAHAACREIVVVSSLLPPGNEDGRYGARDGTEAGGEEDVERRLSALASGTARLERHALALRGHYRIDALLPADVSEEPSS